MPSEQTMCMLVLAKLKHMVNNGCLIRGIQGNFHYVTQVSEHDDPTDNNKLFSITCCF